KVPSKINIVIEIPMGSKCKYELSRTTGSIRVDRILATAMTYPQNYGFVPQTLCEDGDPLDALLLSQVPIFPGTFIKARPIGIVHMIDQKQKDDK
ncbi:inorganic diphosphatase, partial [Candidatus Woesearchaeota archaeon]|nr:inorganic diphosphatase [Candidatus Woesearchaeota archaeon]